MGRYGAGSGKTSVNCGECIMEYHGSCLSEIEKKFYLRILDALRDRLLFVKAEGITEQKSFSKCLSAVQYDYPELFYVDFGHYTYVRYDDGWEYRPKYLYDKAETLKKRRKIDEIAQKIVLELRKRGLSSVYQKCGYIHSYLVRNCTYDEEALVDPDKRSVAYTIEGPLLEKTGVCQGIALAYRLLCRKCEIDAVAVRGVSLRPGTTTYEGHAWNLIRVGGNAAQIDVTWDMCLTRADWPIRYDYFFLPDIEMMRDHQYVGYPICRKMDLSYYDRSRSLFRDLQEIEGFIERVLRDTKHWDQPGTYHFQFKMTNRKDTEEDIKQYVNKLIRKSTNKGYVYTVCTNAPQSVFVYKIEIKD